jgi:hypothetical protein
MSAHVRVRSAALTEYAQALAGTAGRDLLGVGVIGRRPHWHHQRIFSHVLPQDRAPCNLFLGLIFLPV